MLSNEKEREQSLDENQARAHRGMEARNRGDMMEKLWADEPPESVVAALRDLGGNIAGPPCREWTEVGNYPKLEK